MRFRSQNQQASIPSIQLIPMLNVMMGVLAFFVMNSMLLTVQEGVNVELPNDADNETSVDTNPEPLLVKIAPQEQLIIKGLIVSKEELFEQIKTYLSENPQGVVLLQADSQLPYEQVIKLLAEMRQVGGNRVSLAIEAGS